MSAAKARCALFFCALGLFACGEPRRRPDAGQSARPTAPPEGHGLVVERLPHQEPATRIVGLVVNDVVTPLARDAQRDVPKGAALEVGDSGLVLEVGRSGRVVVSASAKVERGALDEAEIVLREGTITASQPVEGNSSRPALRIATPRGTLVLTSGGEIIVAVAPNGRVFAGLWSGVMDVREGTVVEDAGTPRPRLVVGGGSMRLGDGTEPEVLDAIDGEGLEAALRTTAIRFLADNRSGARGCQTEDATAVTLLETLEATRLRVDALRTRHAALVRTDRGAANEASRAIVAETRAVLRHREAVLVWLERSHACAADPASSPLERLLGRARTALAPPTGRP